MCAAMLLASSSAMASGFMVKDQGTKAMGMANAFAAVADDASAAWYNPAALSFQDGTVVTIGGQVVNPKVEYTDKAGKTYSMDKKTHVIPYAYMGYNLQDSPLSFSLAVNAPFGLSTDWTNSGAPFDPASGGITFSQIQMININPTVSYKINDNLSIAAGVMYFDVNKVAFDNTLVTQHGSGTGWGGNAALFYQSDDFNVGISYRSSVKVDVAGTATGIGALAPFGATSVKTSVTMPDMISGGVSFHPVENILLSAQVDWVNWKKFDQLTFSRGAALGPIPTTSTVQENWKATTSFALGAEYVLSETSRLRGGYAFDPTPVNSADFSPRIADNDRHFFSVGYGQDFANMGTMNVTLGYILVNTLNQTASAVATKRNGTYKASIPAFSADYTMRF